MGQHLGIEAYHLSSHFCKNFWFISCWLLSERGYRTSWATSRIPAVFLNTQLISLCHGAVITKLEGLKISPKALKREAQFYFFFTALTNGNDWTDRCQGRTQLVTANLDEAPFLPGMGPFCQGAFHPCVEDLGETVVREAAEPSELYQNWISLGLACIGVACKHGFGQKMWLGSQNKKLEACLHGCMPFAQPCGGHLHATCPRMSLSRSASWHGVRNQGAAVVPVTKTTMNLGACSELKHEFEL